MDRVIEVFPRRPLAPGRRPVGRRGHIAMLVVVLLAAIPAIWFGARAWERYELRRDLQARGVAAEAIEAAGDCSGTRNRTTGKRSTAGCALIVSYRLRPQEGGGLRRGEAYLSGSPPLFTPGVVYDPGDPARVMFEPELKRGTPTGDWLLPAGLAVLPLLLLVLWATMLKRGLARAARNPQPAFVAVERVQRSGPTNRLDLWVRRPDGRSASASFFGETPFLMDDGERHWALALLDRSGRPHLLDGALATVDLTPEERAAIFAAADGR